MSLLLALSILRRHVSTNLTLQTLPPLRTYTTHHICNKPIYQTCMAIQRRSSACVCTKTLKSWICVRQMATKSRHAFEIDSNVARDVVVFTYKNDRLYKMMTLFGIVQFFFWINLAGFCYSDMSNVNMRRQKSGSVPDDNIGARIISAMDHYKYRIAVLCLTLGYLVMFFTWIYPQRSVACLSLLRGGHDVRIMTYSHFGRKRTFDVPLDQVSCLQTRQSKGANVALKVKNKWFHYLLDKKTGQFTEPDLFDYVVGLKREIK